MSATQQGGSKKNQSGWSLINKTRSSAAQTLKDEIHQVTTITVSSSGRVFHWKRAIQELIFLIPENFIPDYLLHNSKP